MPFLFRSSFLGFKAELIQQAWISSEDSANDRDDSISLKFVSKLLFSLKEKSSYCEIGTDRKFWLWSLGFNGTTETCKICIIVHQLLT